MTKDQHAARVRVPHGARNSCPAPGAAPRRGRGHPEARSPCMAPASRFRRPRAFAAKAASVAGLQETAAALTRNPCFGHGAGDCRKLSSSPRPWHRATGQRRKFRDLPGPPDPPEARAAAQVRWSFILSIEHQVGARPAAARRSPCHARGTLAAARERQPDLTHDRSRRSIMERIEKERIQVARVVRPDWRTAQA